MMLLSLSEQGHYFPIGCRHIALDGQSMHFLISEVGKVCLKQGLEPMLSSSQYQAFAASQRRQYDLGQIKTEIDYFREALKSDEKPIDLFSVSKMKARKTPESCR